MTSNLQKLTENGGWRPIEEAPKYKDLLLYREDCKAFIGECGCLAEMLPGGH